MVVLEVSDGLELRDAVGRANRCSGVVPDPFLDQVVTELVLGEAHLDDAPRILSLVEGVALVRLPSVEIRRILAVAVVRSDSREELAIVISDAHGTRKNSFERLRREKAKTARVREGRFNFDFGSCLR